MLKSLDTNNQLRRLLLAGAFVLSAVLGAGALAACDNSAPASNNTSGSTGANTPSAGDPAAGQAVFARYCNSCHPGGGRGAGPSLIEEVPRMSDSRISGTVRHGDGRMPAFSTEQISDSDLANLLAYLHTLK